MKTKNKVLLWLLTTSALGCTNLFGGYLPTIADFNRCPPIGGSVACAVLFVVNPISGSDYAVNAYAVTDIAGTPIVTPYDGSDDTLYGVLNKSGDVIPSLSLGFFGPVLGTFGQGLFTFDGDGICSGFFTPIPSGCGTGAPSGYVPNTYEGPNTYFAYVNENPSPDPRGQGKSGTIGFFAGSGLANDGFAYFSLEDLLRIGPCVLNCTSSARALSTASFSTTGLSGNFQIASVAIQGTVLQTAASAATPEPGSLITGLTGLLIVLLCATKLGKGPVRGLTE